MASLGLNIDEQKAVDRFRSTVVDPSRDHLVILDFWAEWCGPCKALTPVLEKVAADYADKGVLLAKINVDEERFIAGQFQVQSIPTVYAMFQGQPVADLTTARSESQLRAALDQLLAQLPPLGGAGAAAVDIAPLLEMGEAVLAEGDAPRAAAIFAQGIDIEPENPAVHAGLIRALTAADMLDEAQGALNALPEALRKEAGIVQAATALALAHTRVDDSELGILHAAAAADPADMAAQIAYAEAAFAAGQRDEAADTLLAAIRHDPAWNEGAARAKLLQMFEAVGLEDPWVAGQRRKLSLILFG